MANWRSVNVIWPADSCRLSWPANREGVGDMNTQGNFRMTRAAIYSFVAAAMWLALLTGVHSLVVGVTGWGVGGIAVAIAVAGLAVEGSLVRKLEAATIPKVRGYAMMLVWLFVALILVLSFLATPRSLPGTRVYTGIYAAGAVLTLGYAIWQILKCVRSGN
jgi:hypothetical protein